MNKNPIEKKCLLVFKSTFKILEIFLIKLMKISFSKDLKSKKFGSNLLHRLTSKLKKLWKKLLKSLFLNYNKLLDMKKLVLFQFSNFQLNLKIMPLHFAPLLIILLQWLDKLLLLWLKSLEISNVWNILCIMSEERFLIKLLLNKNMN